MPLDGEVVKGNVASSPPTRSRQSLVPRTRAVLVSSSFLFPCPLDGVTLEREDTHQSYGERRVIAIGLADGVHLTLVYTDRAAPEGGTIRRATNRA